MLRNYFKVMFRNLLKNKIFSLINLFGLAVAIACSLLIFLFVKDELSYDKFHKDSRNIYRVVRNLVNEEGIEIPDAKTPPALAIAARNEIPEVTSATRVYVNPDWGGNYFMKYADKKFNEQNLFFVDSNFFDVFTFPFINGSPRNAFKDINSIVITQRIAKKYFGNENPIGRILNADQDLGDLVIMGVVKDIPSNSHFHFDFAISIKKLGHGNKDIDWGWDDFYTYLKVKPLTDTATLTRKIQGIYARNDPKGKNNYYTQPLTSIHLSSNLKSEIEPNGDKLYVYIFSIIGVFVLLIAGFNYVNLATAKAAIRTKEVGVRKVAGASRSSIIGQFLVESVITSLIAAGLAIAIAVILLPTVNRITQKELTIITDPIALGYVVVTALFLGTIAGFFPAIWLSSFKPIDTLKDLKFNHRGVLGLRKVLVVIQFTISTGLIIGALVIAMQMRFIGSAKLGLNKDQVIVVKNAWVLSDADKDAFQHSVLQIRGVKGIATADGVLGGQNWTMKLRLQGSQNSQFVNFLSVSDDFLDVLSIQLKEGRSFSAKFPSDIRRNVPDTQSNQIMGSIILNETAVKALGVPEPVIGKNIFWGENYLKVIGEVKDFYFESFHTEVKPFAFVKIPIRTGNFTIKFSPRDTRTTLIGLENTWKRFSSERPFEYLFLNDTYAKLYASENHFQTLFTGLVVLGIIIACLGLFGLVAFAAQQRKQEIGIRKVLGASVVQIVKLISKDFLMLVLIAFIIAAPIAWFCMDKWLQDFAYRIVLPLWLFPLSGAIVAVIAMLTISFQAISAALTNPVESLRNK